MAPVEYNATFSGSNNHGLQAGYIAGNIEMHHHHPLVEPLKGFNGLTGVSRLEEWQFYNRDAEQRRIAELVTEFGKSRHRLVVLLYGPPGLGKTELAIRALKSLPSNGERNLFVVDGDSEVALQNSFRYIASILHLAPALELGFLPVSRMPEAAQSVDETVRIVIHYLASTLTPWALLVEGYSTTFEIRKYLPDNPRGIVILCAAEQYAAASQLGVSQRCMISVTEPLHGNDLSRLFWSSVTGDTNYVPDLEAKEALHRLIDKFGAHTQSVRTAASYFAPAGQATAQDIQDYMAAVDQQSTAHSGEINGKLWQAWQAHLAKIEMDTGEIAQDALEYFWLRILFSHHHLPTSHLFHKAFHGRHRSDWVAHNHGPRFLSACEEWQSKERFEKAERLLTRYGLISVTREQMPIGGLGWGTKMLKALHLCARRRLKAHNFQQGNTTDYMSSALCVLGESIKWSFEANDVAYRHSLVSHVEDCLELGEAHLRDMDTRTASNILLNFAAVYIDGGRFKNALKLQKEALNRLELEFGPEFDLTLKAMSEVASTEHLLDQSAEAMHLREVVFHYRKLQYQANKNDPTVERNYDIAAAEIAVSYARVPTRKHDAMHYREMVVEHATAAQNSSCHLEINRQPRLALLKAKRELAMSYYELDRRLEAYQLREEVVRDLGNEEHVFALNSQRELLVSLMDARQFCPAQELADQVVESSKRLLGVDHPDTMLALSTRGALKRLMGDNFRAKTELDKAIGSLRTLLGESHSTVIHAMVDLAHVHKALDENDDAMRIFSQVSSYFESQNDTYQQLRVEMEIAALLQQQGSKIALTRLESVVAGFLEQGYPPHDPAVISARLRLAGCLHQFRRLTDAAAEYERTLAFILDANGEVQTSNRLKAKLRLAMIYEELAKTTSDTLSEFDTFLAMGLNSRLIADEDLHSVDEQLSFGMVLKNVISHCCGDSSPQDKDTLVCPSPDDSDHPVYRGMSCKVLRDTALVLREEVVNSAVGPEGGLIVVNQLTAQACHELADAYAIRYEYRRAVSFQTAVVAFYLRYVGEAHPDTILHRNRCQEWAELASFQREDSTPYESVVIS